MTSLSDIEQKAIRRLSYGERMRPTRDWLILLAAAAVIFLASAGWNAWFYYDLLHTGISAGAAPLPVLDTNAVTAAEATFSDRAAEETNYETTYQFVDPSK